jgi:hypothetical protein
VVEGRGGRVVGDRVVVVVGFAVVVVGLAVVVGFGAVVGTGRSVVAGPALAESMPKADVAAAAAAAPRTAIRITPRRDDWVPVAGGVNLSVNRFKSARRSRALQTSSSSAAMSKLERSARAMSSTGVVPSASRQTSAVTRSSRASSRPCKS